MAPEGITPLLAVGDRFHARGLLDCDHLVDGPILGTLELRWGDAACLELAARLDQVGGPQHAADHIAVIVCHRNLFLMIGTTIIVRARRSSRELPVWEIESTQGISLAEEPTIDRLGTAGDEQNGGPND